MYTSRPHVVPEINSTEDEANIQRIALSLSNPSPRDVSKGFDFDPTPFVQSPRWSTGMFSPNGFPNVFSFMASQTPQPTHYPALSAAGAMNPSPFVAPLAPTTPQSTLVALPHRSISNLNNEQPQPSQQQQSQQASLVPVKKEEPKVEEPIDIEQADATAETDAEEDYNEDQVPYTSDSEASYQDERPTKQQQARRKRKASHALVSSTARTFGDLTDEQIAFMDFKELTRLMTAAGLSRQAIAETKARRRRLKNRQSARLCSNKKRELCAELASDKTRLNDQLSHIQSAYQKLQKEHAALRQQYEALLQANKRSRDQ